MLIAVAVIFAFLAVWIGFATFGLRKKKWSKIAAIGGGFVAACFILAIIGLVAIPTPPENKEAEREQLIERQFSAWDGSHRKLEAFVKSAMHDPASYEHVATRYWDRGDFLVVQTEFRGKNAFGGVVKNHVKAKVALDGEVMEIVDAN